MMKNSTKPLPWSNGLRKLFTLIVILLVAVSSINGQKHASGKLSFNTAEELRPILFAFGIGSYGRLGTGNENDVNSLVAVNNDNDWKQVSAGGDYSLAVKSDGSLWAWGNGNSGRLGTGNTDLQNHPVKIGQASNWDQVSAGSAHSLAIKTDGTLWAWGSGNSGRLGAGNDNDQDRPVQVGEVSDWVQVIAGFSHSFALKSNGTLWAWGSGSSGRLGTGNTDHQYSPVQIGSATNWTQISTSDNHSLAIKADGTLWAWGSGSNGKLGTGNTDSQHLPVQVGEATDWVQVSAGRWHSVALKSDGTLWAWGTGNHLGTGNSGNDQYPDQHSPVQVGQASDWRHVSAGQDHTLAIKADGTLWSWGNGADGALGIGNTIDQHSPVQIGDQIYTYASAGGFHSLALRKKPLSPDANGIFYIRKGSIGNGSSWENAGSDLTEAVNDSRAGQQIWVAAGEYQPASGQSFSMQEGVKIYGGFPATGSPAMKDRNYATNVTILKGNNASVVYNNFNFLTNAAILDGFTITGGSASEGGGIYNRASSPLMRNLVVKGNSATSHGGGIALSAGSDNFRLENSLVNSNTASAHGGGIYVLNSSSPVIVNVTISGNTAGSGGSGVTVERSNLTVHNSIIWSNSGTALNFQGPGADGRADISYSLVQGSGGSGNWQTSVGSDNGHNLDTNPLFKDAGNNNYQIAVSSPAVNAGNSSLLNDAVAISDLAGEVRIYGVSIDMGAYEAGKEIFLVRYVRQNGGGNGGSWENASGDLQAMINAEGAEQVWVAAGEYKPASGQSFSMKEGVKIYGGFSSEGTPAFTDRNWNQNVTTLKGNGKSVIVNDNNGLTNAALLDGFTIIGGSAVTGGGMLNHLSYPLINRCIFKANNATVWGGGIYNDGPGSTTIVNSLFIQNTAQSGGAAFSYQNAKPRFTNVTLVNNTADQNGGALHNYEGAETELVNAIVWGNVQSTSSSQLYTSGPGKTKAYFSVLEGGENAIIGDKESVQVFSLDPLFVDPVNGNFTLQGCSPALNIGTGGVLNGFTTDLNGNSRFFDGIVDAGAYEYQAASLTGADRLAVNGYTTSVDISSGQIYDIQAADDACRSVAVISSEGDTPVSGIVHITTHIDNTVQTYNGSPYLQRYYDMSPATNSTTATARVTLYFTQTEFSAYNTSLGRTELPSGPNEDTGSLRVFQYHGSPKQDQTGPAAYQGTPATIIPELRWHYGLARWEVSFDVKGFSGFFIGSAQAPLPVKLVSFDAILSETHTVLLQWRVSEQVDMDHYSLEYSNNGRDFTTIGNIPASQTAESRYEFTDIQTHLNNIAYYRLRMGEIDGSYAYSRIISVKIHKQHKDGIAYPIPAHDFVRIKSKDLTGTSLKLVNSQGVILKLIQVTSDDHEIDVSSLPAGVYLITTNAGQTMKIVKN
jgi:alpha-tubulin suppressor-like RCC1 family protein